ncbi:hypothetical protein D3C79_545830 [compost metagenome]
MTMRVAVSMIVMMTPTSQKQSTDDIHNQTADSDHSRRSKLHLGRLKKTQYRFDTDA